MVKNNNNPRVPPIGGPSPSFDPLPLINSLVGLGTQAISNKQQRKLEAQRRKYDTAQWERQNKYNHPLEQMARLKAAGLNPNLIYGSSPGSAVGNAGAIPAGQAPEYSLNNPVTGYMNTKVAQAQTNNMNTAAMKNIAAANLSDSQRNKLNSILASEITMAEEGAKQSKTETFMAALRKEAATIPDKGLIAEQMVKVEIALQDKKKAELANNVLKLKSDLAKRGIRETDPLAVRLMATILGVDLSKPIDPEKAKEIADFMKNPWDKLTAIIEEYTN
jgi:hypothetical protein